MGSLAGMALKVLSSLFKARFGNSLQSVSEKNKMVH